MRFRFLATACLTVASACSENAQTPRDPTEPAGSWQSGPVQAQPRSIEDDFASVERDVPGFAGFYINDDGVLVARLKDMSQAANARARLRPLALAYSGTEARAPTDEVIELGAQYTFSELRQWRDVARQLLGISGVVGLDADERRNRVWIGVASGSMRADLLSRAHELGIPLAALVVEESAPVPPLATLRDSIRPLPGGMKIDPDAVTWCTQTVNGFDPSYGFGFFSCSHCTGLLGSVDGTKVYQPNDVTGEYIGLEVRDAPLFTGSPCPAGRRCGWADVAYFQHTHSGIGEFGAIAQPTEVCTANCSDNETALTISTTNPRWYVWSDYMGSIAVGIGLQKVGARTGWTSGLVTNSCYDWNDPDSDITRLCQVRTNGISDGGDSGSPVFRFVAGAGFNKVSLYGILFAGSPTIPAFVFSPWTRVVDVFGPIQTHAEPLSTSIVHHDVNFYTNTPAGGFLPYVSSYWEACGFECDGGAELSAPAARGGVTPNTIVPGWHFLSTDWTVYWRDGQRWLRATVTDSQNQQAVATYWVP